ncbi:MAG: Na/Pi cotransporter family protein [Roseateles asaccharophilus]|uniref:Phosphate:Na+ symporter n=1 Tax=Roseateles asaccharophilus TaxID=582607 RepID=A0A4R6MYN8_9BURK|nr:Na/Pi symporter [Roseateles asaccharophilus]MDN3545827.1 Na/Pi symporter [Roseateles asaccharophilus]TDP07694.1 phosphate:Na+ symporter [Roseateles asaccharophilus]
MNDLDLIDLPTLGTIAGGLGLFLLGMGLMTEGLKLAAGPALHRILAGATRTRVQALGSGLLVTALVQSSSAVTVAVIGFVNAGLLALGPALWVLFGANVGTSMTGWIVALIGLKFKVELLAMPLAGLGALLRLVGEGRRSGAIGTALAGFGLLFMGIALLQQAFAGLAGQISLPQDDGPLGVLAQLGIGLLMTVLMQSSSAAMAITLTAAQGGLIGAQGAAAVVIGANIGTTVTALLAAIAATPNARRAALAHVVFNLLTGVVALLLLPWLIGMLGQLREALGLPPDPATTLALFHTTFNVMGILLIWPLASPLSTWLQQCFRVREEDEALPRHLDDTVLAIPTLALDALQRETARVGEKALELTRRTLRGAHIDSLKSEQAALLGLGKAIDQFADRLRRAAMSSQSSTQFADVLRLQRHYLAAAEQALVAATLTPAHLPEASPGDMAAVFQEAAEALLLACQPEAAPEAPGLEAALSAMESGYEALKTSLLTAGVDGRLTLGDMEQALRRYSALQLALQQLRKAKQRLGSAPLAA